MWIDIKEKRPTQADDPFLVTDGIDCIEITSQERFFILAETNELTIPARYGAGCTVKYWMPIPKLPILQKELFNEKV